MSPILDSIGSVKGYGWGSFAAVDLGVMFPISSFNLSTTSSSVTFTGIPSTYTHLQLRIVARSARSTFSNDGINMTFNSDTSSSYSRNKMDIASTGFDVGSTTSATFIFIQGLAGNAADSAVYGVAIIDIPEYKNANKYKVSQNFSGIDTNSPSALPGWICFSSGVWHKTSAITTITLTGNQAAWLPNSSFSLYGIKEYEAV